jgi:hypothetical protein
MLVSYRHAIHGKERETIAVGDIVILKEDGTPRLFWKLAKIKDLIQSADGIIRAARIQLVRGDKAKTTELRRPIQHLIPLELHMEPELPSPNDEEVSTASPPAIETTTKGRPRRKAAVIGELLRKGQ